MLIQRDLVRCKTLVGSETSPSEYVHPLDGSIAYSASALAPPPSTSAPPPISAALPSSPFSGQIPSGREAHSLSHIHVPLIRLAVGRSGDKGDTANVAFLARKPEYFSILKSQVTTDVVRAYLAHLLTSPDENGMGGSEVQRYEVPGVCAINFVVTKYVSGLCRCLLLSKTSPKDGNLKAHIKHFLNTRALVKMSRRRRSDGSPTGQASKKLCSDRSKRDQSSRSGRFDLELVNVQPDKRWASGPVMRSGLDGNVG